MAYGIWHMVWVDRERRYIIHVLEIICDYRYMCVLFVDALGAHKLVSAHKHTHITHITYHIHITLITEINHGTITQQPFTTALIVEGKKI